MQENISAFIKLIIKYKKKLNERNHERQIN